MSNRIDNKDIIPDWHMTIDMYGADTIRAWRNDPSLKDREHTPYSAQPFREGFMWRLYKRNLLKAWGVETNEANCEKIAKFVKQGLINEEKKAVQRSAYKTKVIRL